MDEFDFKQMAQDLSRVHSGLQHLSLAPVEPNVNILADAYSVLHVAFDYFVEMARNQTSEANVEPEETTEKE